MDSNYWSDKIMPVIVSVFFGAVCTFLLTWAAGLLNREIPRAACLEWSLTPPRMLRFSGESFTFQEVRVCNVGTACEDKVWVRFLRVPPGCCEIDTALIGVAKANAPTEDPVLGTLQYEFESVVEGGSICMLIRLPDGESFDHDDVEVFGLLSGFGILESRAVTPARNGAYYSDSPGSAFKRPGVVVQ